MSKLYAQVKRLYDLGRYTKENVAEFVKRGKLTPEEYKLITGDDYVAPEE